MASLDDLFVKEFRSRIRNFGSKDIFNAPLPDSVKDWEVTGCDVFAVKGDIDDEYYGKLKSTVVKDIPRGSKVAKRKYDKATRSFMRNDDGTFIYEDVTIPTGSKAVVSDKSISLPYGYKKEGFGYVDFVQTGSKIKYIYIIPKIYLYKVNQVALALSVKNMKNYSGMGYVTWDNGTVFLHLIPYNPRASYVGSKILKTKAGLSFDKEIKEIVDYWMMIGYIPNLALCNVNGENIALKQTAVGYNDYMACEDLSLGVVEIYGKDTEVEDNG